MRETFPYPGLPILFKHAGVNKKPTIRVKAARLFIPHATSDTGEHEFATILKIRLRCPDFALQSTPVSTEQGAEEHLRAIRLLMERATIYRAISAPTAFVGGLLSLLLSSWMLLWQSADVSRNVDARVYFVAWSLVFLLALAANMLFIVRGTRRRGESPVSSGMKLAVRSIMPSFFAGAAISACLTLTTDQPILPTVMWLVFYGLGLLSTMNFAPRSIIILGWAFLFTGVGVFIFLMYQSILPAVDLPTPTRFYPAVMMGGHLRPVPSDLRRLRLDARPHPAISTPSRPARS